MIPCVLICEISACWSPEVSLGCNNAGVPEDFFLLDGKNADSSMTLAQDSAKVLVCPVFWFDSLCLSALRCLGWRRVKDQSLPVRAILSNHMRMFHSSVRVQP